MTAILARIKLAVVITFILGGLILAIWSIAESQMPTGYEKQLAVLVNCSSKISIENKVAGYRSTAFLHYDTIINGDEVMLDVTVSIFDQQHGMCHTELIRTLWINKAAYHLATGETIWWCSATKANCPREPRSWDLLAAVGSIIFLASAIFLPVIIQDMNDKTNHESTTR